MTIVNYQGSSIASIDRVSVAKSGVRQHDSLPVRLVAAIGNVKYGIGLERVRHLLDPTFTLKVSSSSHDSQQ